MRASIKSAHPDWGLGARAGRAGGGGGGGRAHCDAPRTAHPAHRPAHPTHRPFPGDIGKELGALWKKTADADKVKFTKMAEDDKARYAKAMAAYNPASA